MRMIVYCETSEIPQAVAAFGPDVTIWVKPDPVERASDDSDLIAEQARQVRRLREEVELVEHHRDGLVEEIAELFNAPDTDTWDPLDSVRAAHAYIEGESCKCVAPRREDEEPWVCQRCQILGRQFDAKEER